MSVVSKLSPRDRQLAGRLGRMGIRKPFLTVAALRKADIKPQTAVALLRKESGGGRHVFGHDHGSNLPDRPPYSGHNVTERRARLLFASRFSNGVAETQLTSRSFVQIARRRGGEWRPFANMWTGFELLGNLIREHGVQDGAARYNGGDSPVGERNGAAYGRDFVRQRNHAERELREAGFSV
jgi:hypothetical protein